VETWARGVTVASLFPQLDTRDADELHRALAAPIAATSPKPEQQQQEQEKGLINTSQWVRRGDAANDPRVAEQRRLASKILDMSFKMFLRDNYVHGDLHAGNLVSFFSFDFDHFLSSIDLLHHTLGKVLCVMFFNCCF
jgi:hypothetical protein